jgi:hypothetical protein
MQAPEALMSILSPRLIALLLVLCALASARTFAQTAPTPVARNGVTYITGGIGEDEVQAFRAAAATYNMRITLASKSGHYLSDVDIKITSGQREVLSVRTEGPFLFVSAQPGRYQIVAQDRTLTETKQVVVPARGGVDVRFYWDDPDRHGVMQLCRRCPKPIRK